MPRFVTETYTAPSYWACYLINGDASSIEDEKEIAEADAFIEDVGLGSPVDFQEIGFCASGDYGSLAGDYGTYSFLRETNGDDESQTPNDSSVG